ncbi:MAG: putative quinol monooxygenase [Chloroflexota bacterium]
MIVIAGQIPIRGDKREEAIAAALEMAAATQQEEGCISYDFHASLADPNIIFIFEEWESDAALQAHFQTPHMAEFRKKLPNIVAGPGQLKRYEVSSVGSL